MPLDLQAIKERVANATPGPWNWEKWDFDEFEGDMPILVSEETEVLDFGVSIPYDSASGNPPSEKNAQFIAHAREDVPALIAEVERLQAELTEVKDLAKFHYEESVEFFGALEDILAKADEAKESFIEESVLDEIVNIAEKALEGESK